MAEKVETNLEKLKKAELIDLVIKNQKMSERHTLEEATAKKELIEMQEALASMTQDKNALISEKISLNNHISNLEVEKLGSVNTIHSLKTQLKDASIENSRLVNHYRLLKFWMLVLLLAMLCMIVLLYTRF